MISDDVSANFHAWFGDPHDRQAKLLALERAIEMEKEQLQEYRLFD